MTPIPLQETQLAELFRLREKCAAQAAVIEKLRCVLQELVDLTEDTRAGDYTPDSFTCQPAFEALAIPTDSKQILSEWLDKQLETFYHAVRNEALEDAAKVCDLQQSEHECPERATYCAEAIRNLKETK